MTLVTPRLHKDERGAALSLTANRASKVRRLRAHGTERTDRLAESYELELYRDVLAHISDGSVETAEFYRALANVALSALPEDEKEEVQ